MYAKDSPGTLGDPAVSTEQNEKVLEATGMNLEISWCQAASTQRPEHAKEGC